MRTRACQKLKRQLEEAVRGQKDPSLTQKQMLTAALLEINLLERTIDGHELFWSWIRGCIRSCPDHPVLEIIRTELDQLEAKYGIGRREDYLRTAEACRTSDPVAVARGEAIPTGNEPLVD